MKTLIAGLVLAAAAAASQAQVREPLGMVIDVQGKGTINDSGKSAPLEMLSYLRPNSEVQLSPGASLTFTW